MSGLDTNDVAFFDTQALHFVHLYLKWAKNDRLYPFGRSSEGPETAIAGVDGLTEKPLRHGLKKGLCGVVWLLGKSIQVQYSPASELELMMGRARGKAVENAAQEGLIPDRMWTRVDDTAIAGRLVNGELTDIKIDVDALGEMMEEAGILAAVLDERKNTEVMELAKGIGGLVYLGSMDMMIFASALAAQANLLITEDRFLRRTVNGVRTGTVRIRDQLVELVSQVSLVDAGQVVLPEAMRVPSQ